MRRFIFLIVSLSLGAPADGETVKLRKKDNGNIIDVEIVEIQVDQVGFRMPGGDRVYTVGWDSLDTTWIRQNSPAVWNEHELLMQPKPTEKKVEEPDDPFAKESPAADAKELLRTLASTLNDKMRGIDPSSISNFCREASLEEATFWRGYDDLRRASGTFVEPKTPEADKSSKGSRSKDSNREQRPWERDPASQAREYQLKAEIEKGRTIITGIGYIRTLAEGGYKGRLAWQCLRHSTEDRKGLIARLRKYEALASELAERIEKPESKRDALVLRKLLSDVATSFERISKENNTQEEKLKSDCQSLLARLNAGR